jgi:hypothetical protein
MGKKGIIRQEPTTIEFLEAYPECQHIFQKVGWFSFFAKFQGYNNKVTRAFIEGFNGTRAQVGNLKFEISKDSIVVVTGCLKVVNDGLNTNKWKGFRHDFVPIQEEP